MITLSINDTVSEFTKWARFIAEDQIPFATALAMTRTAQDVRNAEKAAMPAQLDRPTRFTLNSLYVRGATKQRLKAEVWLKDTGDTAARQYLRSQIHGGTRPMKRFERALQGAGLMPQGWVAVPGKRVPLDAFGNVPGKFVVQLLSYLSAFSEQGYSANMTDKRKAKLADRKLSARGFVQIGGVMYFVSHGPGERNGRRQHLPRGIWAKSGTHGVDVWPVFLFVPAARYRGRFTFYETAQATIDRRFPQHWRQAWAEALRSRR